MVKRAATHRRVRLAGLAVCVLATAALPALASHDPRLYQGLHEPLQYPRETRIAERQTTEPARDPVSGNTYSVTVDVLIREAGEFKRRFSVHAPGGDLAGLARQTASFLALLWGMADARLGRLNSRLRAAPIDVWLCRDGAGGGQMSRTSIYVYEVTAARSGLEWARTLAHEFGHFVLPGPSGYKEPESWSNGLLGERLFLSWLRDELVSGRLPTGSAPFTSSEALEDYCAKQPDALIQRLASRGPSIELLRGDGKAAMDEANALFLYAARFYGPAVIQELLIYLPRGSASRRSAVGFLEAFIRWVEDATSFTLHGPWNAERMVYIPGRSFTVTARGGSISSLRVDRANVRALGEGRWHVKADHSGWVRLSTSGVEPGSGEAPVLQWHRQEGG